MLPLPVVQFEDDHIERVYQELGGTYVAQVSSGSCFVVSAVDGCPDKGAAREEVLASIQASREDFARGDWIEAREASRLFRERYGI